MSTKLLRIALLLVAAFMAGVSARADIPSYTMPRSDKKCDPQTVDGSLMFYDHGGSGGDVSSTYYQTLCIFKGANEGDVLTITFNKVDLDGPTLYIYDGEIDANNSVTDGYIGSLTGQSTGETFEATSGTLSVLYYSTGFDNAGEGFEALIESAPASDMVWSSVTGASPASLAYPGATTVPLACMDLLTDGGGNPLSLDKVTFTLSGTGMEHLTNVRCIYGRSDTSPAGGTQVGEALDTPAASMTFSGQLVLKPKHNYVWLVADIKTDAVPSTLLTAGCTSVIVAGQERLDAPFTSSESVEIKNMVFMPVGPATYKVGDTPTLFYDDGGPDNNITEGFTGEVTFAPTHAGKKVRIVFESLDLFNTSSTGYNDQLSVYNGCTADPANLIATLLKEPMTLSSTSPDGALTISLKSTTGYPKGGWVARVEEFEPQPMTVTAVTVTDAGAKTVAANAAVDALNVQLSTTGTEPAMTVSAMKVSVAGSTAPVASVSVTDAKGTVLATAAPQADVATLTFATPVALSQTGNSFTLQITPAATALSGESVSLSLTDVTLASGTMTPASSPTATIAVDNICMLEQGTHEYTIFGSWTLSHEPASNSYLAYDGAAGERIVVLHPGTEGKFIELEFDHFSINWPSYGYAPTFKVYSGSSATGTPIWECTNSQAKVGPDKPLRSSATDGSMTIVFNPNGNNGSLYSTPANGIHANLREYVPTPMTVEKVEVSQASTAPLKAADTDAPVLRIEVETAGDLDPVSLDEIKVNLKDVAGYVTTVKLYTTGKEATFTNPTLLTSATLTAGDTEVTLAPQAFRLPEKTSYYWVTFDMAETIEAGHDMDASVASAKIGGAAYTDIINPDPEGSRPSVSVYYFEGNDAVVDVNGSLLFYDDGGEDANYTTGHKGAVTFRPREGELIKLEFVQFYVNTRDKFTVHDGANTDGTLRANLYGDLNEKLPAPIFSASEDGCLTINFTGQYAYNPGWQIIVSSVAPELFNIQSVEFTPIEGVKLLRGATDAAIGRLKVTYTGNRGPLPVTAFNFSTEGTTAGTLASLSLTTSDALDTYDSVNEIAAGTDGALTAADYSVTAPGTAYYWLRADIAANAPADATVSLKLTSIQGEAESLWQTESETIAMNLTSGLSGTYTIGSSEEADYATFAAATAALAGGVEGPVTFLVESGVYEELVSISEIPGTSETNCVTFRSATGNRDDVTIHYEIYTSSYGSPEYGVVTLDGADWITFESMTMTTAQKTFPAVVKAWNSARHFTLRDCHIYTAPGIEYGEPTLVECKVNMDQIPNRNNDYVTIDACLIEGGDIGVELGGTGIVNPVRLPRERGGIIRDCIIKGQRSKGIYINNEADGSILHNYIESGENAAKSYNAMDLYNALDNFLVDGNTILHAYGQSSSSGIYLRPAEGTQEAYPRIINNEVILANASGSVSGIRINTPSPYTLIAHNSVVITGVATGSSCLYFYDTMDNGRVVNNIFDNKAEGYAVYSYKTDYLTPSFSHNMMRTSDAQKFCYIGAEIASLEAWATATTDDTSFTAEVEYLADDILEPVDFAPLAKGEPLTLVTADISGTERDKTTPTVGAYEQTSETVTPVPAEGYPVIDAVTHESARLTLAANCHGTARVIVLPAEAKAPTAEEMEASSLTISLRKGRPATAAITGLEANTTYKAWISIVSLRDVTGDTFASQEFTTSYVPTAVSTFEDVEMIGDEAPGAFNDGTARFDGFVVSEMDNLPVAGSLRAATMEDTEATVTLTNASNLVLDGFWLTNSATLTLTARTAEESAEPATKTIEAGDWRYINLRDMGEIAGLVFYTEGTATIDDFSGKPLPLSVEVTAPQERVNQGDNFTLEALTAGGVAPFTYLWSNSLNEPLGSQSALSSQAEKSTIYSLTVADAWGNTVSAMTRVNVTGDMVIGTFDDLYLEPDSEWVGDKDDPDYTSGTFLTGTFELSNYYMAEWNSWSWFGYASYEGDSYSSLADQMVCAAGSGLHGSQNYGVGFLGDYYGPCIMRFSNTEQAQTIPGLWITNTAWVKDAVFNGDGMSDEFTKGDYCSVKISGVNADGTYTDPIEIPLADFRADDEADYYCLDTWQWHPLDSLGDVTGLRFEFFSTKRNSYGITTPSYVCIDNLGDACPVEEAEALTMPDDQRAIDLDTYFEFDPEAGHITYTLLSGEATIAGSQAVVTAPMHSDTTLLIRGTQRGCSRWISIPVNVTVASVGMIDASQVTGVDVYTTEGLCIFSGATLPSLDPGIYIIVRHTLQGDTCTVERR